MTAAKTLTALRTHLETVAATNVVVAARDSRSNGGTPEPVFQRLRIRDDLAEAFLRIARNAVGNGAAEFDLRPYDTQFAPRSDALCYIHLPDKPKVQGIVESLADVDGVDLFKQEPDIVRNLRFYTLLAQDAKGRAATFFRACTQKIELSRGKGIAAVFSRGYYEKAESNLFLFDPYIDCFAFRDHLFIRSAPKFHSIFQYYEELVAAADETIAAVTDRVPVVNLEAFRAMCESSPQMLAKLAHVAKQPYFEDITMADIKRTIAEVGQEKLDVEIRVEDGVEKLVFEGAPAKRWKILSLLDDDFLKGILTSRTYESNSKIPI